MPVTTTYPGIYIEELPATTHAVTAAPTSVTVFVGFTNPFWKPPQSLAVPPPRTTLPQFGAAVPLQSFADYQNNFGGFFSSPWQPDYVGQAVYQFFLNGGSNAYVVALKAGNYFDTAKSLADTTTPVTAATATLGATSPNTLQFTALQPVWLNAPLTMTVTLANISGNSADLTIVYGTTVETYRSLQAWQLIQAVNSGSALATVTAGGLDTFAVSGDQAPDKSGTLVTKSSAGAPGTGQFAQGTQLYAYTANDGVQTLSGVTLVSGRAGATLSDGTSVIAGTFPTYTGIPASAADTSVSQNFTYPTNATPQSTWTVVNPAAVVSSNVFGANQPLDKVSVFNLMVLPGITDSGALDAALAYCATKRAFLIMDPPANAVSDTQAESLPGGPANADTIADLWTNSTPPLTQNGAIYFPYLSTTDPVTSQPATSPPSGFVAGIFASEDVNRGVWKSPAGLETTILGTSGVVPWGMLTDPQQGTLNGLGVNCIRTFPGLGSVVFGARTLVSANPSYQQWKYVAVRRMALFVEQSLYSSLKWAIFEPNATPLWNALTQEVSAFMLGLYRQGAFAGSTVNTSFQVQCDSTTTSSDDIANGIVNIIVAFAPLKPAEFVVVQIAQLAGQTQS